MRVYLIYRVASCCVRLCHLCQICVLLHSRFIMWLYARRANITRDDVRHYRARVCLAVLCKRRYYNSSTSRLHCAARVSRLSCGFSRDQNEIDWGDLQTPDASAVWIIVNHKDFEYPRYIPHSLRQINKQMCA
mgnify:CR=1 FL=1